MKIYDMIEGKWLKTTEKNENKEQDFKDFKDFGIRIRLVTYDEEKKE